MAEQTGRRARQRLVLALDLADLDAARRLAGSCAESFATVKVGFELFTSVGPRAVGALLDDGFAVFVDLKLHDIPTTVKRAAAVIASLGASYTTVHASGGAEMMAAAREGLSEGSSPERETIALAVTALTSEETDAAAVARRAGLAAEVGLGGLVCAASDLAIVAAAAPGLLRVVPGIRPSGGGSDDQRRFGTPEQAVLGGADLLVIGRPVTGAPDPAAAGRAIAAAVERAESTDILVNRGIPR